MKDFETALKALKALKADFKKSENVIVKTDDLQYTLSIFRNMDNMLVVVASYNGTAYIGLDLASDWKVAQKKLNDFINLNALHA